MTQEDKELLLKDLGARVIYRPKVYIEGDWVEDEIDSYDTTLTFEKLVDYKNNNYILKPYLRPMSSMTEEERLELSKITHCNILYINDAIGVTFKLLDDATFLDNIKAIDWLNSHHFDYRGLIEKGLAIEAPEDMYDVN